MMKVKKKMMSVVLGIMLVASLCLQACGSPAEETPKAMEQLILAYMDARNDANINQLLLIPCVILDFLSIHPFKDGNGRMSRLLSLLLLYKNDFVPLMSSGYERFFGGTSSNYLKEVHHSWQRSSLRNL